MVDKEADELLRISERLAGKGWGDAVRVVAVMLVLGSDTVRGSAEEPWNAGTPETRLARVVESSFSRERSTLQAEWQDWLRVANRSILFPDETPFREFPVGRLAEAAEAVHHLLLRLPAEKRKSRTGEVFERFLSLANERQGKTGGTFSTPRSVNELIIRLADLRLGMVVGDFYAGVGGTLITALDHVGVPARGETPISGAELNQAAVFLARVNLLLHDTDPGLIRHENTLASWRPTDDQGRSFDRVLSNPPFSLRYDQSDYRAPQDLLGRTSGTKSELMMLQQMRASVRPGGRVIMAMAHGPLFRGGQEEHIRRALLERSEIEAVVGFGPNLFQGTSIPACLLVLRSPVPNRAETSDVLFINAEREVVTGRNQNRLEPRHIEKIARVFHQRAELPGFSRVVPIAEIADNAYNLNIGRYIGPSAEQVPVLDLGAMVNGGVPPREVKLARQSFAAFGLNPEQFLEQRTDGYLVPPGSGGFADVAERLSELCEPVADHLAEEFDRSWPEIVRRAHPPTSRPTFDAFRQSLVDGFCAKLTEAGVLDEYELAGAFAQGWADHVQEIRDRFHGDRQDLVEDLVRWLSGSLKEQIRELVRNRQRSLVETVRQWDESYGCPLSRLLEQSEEADRRFEARLRELGLEPGSRPG
ncbi:N-6 DNA methylase [Nocardiopsis alborubida]|uniref:site-specific DNA-methyltransferase (adenine-specific) n=1 Tax=Nocardiopsis alborubida TaxID=146802 RepID=A0A7X6MHX2_9ACTN|nr:N-6 DNA methylase [Nocardiopsis alborubida]NKZ00019.1 N-6 DNA methylase [Nocardiopsis alborubida]